ncbi:MAG: PAS domain S-box protein [Proteobacteria bacterium]|nr:PAS domain S-box protein [Pseudomonadota bacterium]MBU4420853.1 PAS domain S-box protein [Pseudomonadota bacterium]MBU4504164.1 PAS domain S-box protein [Pseudomonadota bacterium]MCG2829455.1 PAS domain S-box protein [Desulfobacteraceae bacterium]
MKIGYKLILGFLTVAMMVGVIGYIGVANSKHIGESFEQSERLDMPSLIATMEIESAARQASIKAMEYSLRGEKGDREKTFEALEKLDTHFNALEKSEETEISVKGQDPGDEASRIQAIGYKIDNLKTIIGKYIALKDQEISLEELFVKEEEIHNARKDLIHLLYEQKDYERKELDESLATTKSKITQGANIISILSLLSVFIAFLIGFFITRSISRPIQKLKNAANEISKGNLSITLDINSDDEIGDLSNAFNKMANDLVKYHKNLEKMVEDRTAELKTANNLLQKEISERRRNEESLFKSTNLTQVAYNQSIIYAEHLKKEIAEHKLAEEALKESENRYRTLFEDSRDGICISTRDGRLVDINQSWLDIFGYLREEVINMDVRGLYVNYDDRIRFQREIEQGGSVRDYEIKLFKKDGTEIDCIMTVMLWRANGGSILGYWGMIRDVTEQKLLEAQLIQAQKMEAVGTLAGGIAHDFNNTLQVILGYAQLLLDNKKGKDIENSYIKTIEKSAQRAAELTSQLLVFSRKVESELRPVSLNQELIKEERLLRRTISQMIDIELKPAENLNIINADPAQLGQIIMNLAINARDAMPNGGKLIFETKNIILDEKYCKVNLGIIPGGYVLMSVSDTGNGMDKDTLEHIFEPFYTTKQTGEGTGLGLSMVYGIVKSHGGHITCNSKPGHGTVFNIYFPVIKEIDNLEQAEPKNEAEIYGGNETVLIVDDVKSILELGQYMLSPYGYKIIKAENGEEAIKIYKTEKDRIDLVILDIDMPGMGGDKCLQEFLKINPDIKAIIASGYTGKLKIKEFMKNGAAGYVCKPYRLEDMLKNVREVLGNSVEERV